MRNQARLPADALLVECISSHSASAYTSMHVPAALAGGASVSGPSISLVRFLLRREAPRINGQEPGHMITAVATLIINYQVSRSNANLFGDPFAAHDKAFRLDMRSFMIHQQFSLHARI